MVLSQGVGKSSLLNLERIFKNRLEYFMVRPYLEYTFKIRIDNNEH